MIVTIHQPNLFPWLGFFNKMLHSDLFIVLDHVPFTKRSFQNRVQLKGPQGPQWLTLPVETKGKFAQRTCDVLISDTVDWKKNHLKTLELLYRKSPNFPSIFPKVEKLYHHPYEKLTDFTIPSIQLMMELLDIKKPMIQTSKLGVKGQSSRLLCDLVQKVGGNVYLSGPSGRNYLDEKIFVEKGIEVRYHHFEPFPYPQRFGGFVDGLSVLDYLFNQSDLSEWQPNHTKKDERACVKRSGATNMA